MRKRNSAIGTADGAGELPVWTGLFLIMASSAGNVFSRLAAKLHGPAHGSIAASAADRRNPASSARAAAQVRSEVRSEAIIETDIPTRLDALPFGRFHILVIVALGITWILDGLEVTLAGAL